MGKKNRHRNHQRPEAPPAAPPASPAQTPPTAVSPGAQSPTTSLTDLVAEAAQLGNLALGGATDTEIEAAVKLEAPAEATDDDLRKAVKQAQEAVSMFSAQEQRARAAAETAEKAHAAADEARVALDAERAAASKERLAAAAERSAVEKERSELRDRESSLLKREQGIHERELNAEADFAVQRRDSLQRLSREATALRDEISNGRTIIANERAAWERQRADEQVAQTQALSRQRAEVEKDISAVRATTQQELEAQRSEMEKERARLKNEAAKIEVDLELLEEDREALDAKVERRLGAKLEDMSAQIKDLEERLAAAREDRDRLFEVQRTRDEAERQLGHRTLEEIASELAALAKERDDLRKQVATRAPATALARLEELERHKEEWENERQGLLREVLELRHSLGRSTVAVTELETLRDQKAALESGRDLLHAALEELRKDVNERIRRSDGVSPFPSCSQMDSASDLQTRPGIDETVADLRAFAEDLRQRIAYDPTTGKELFYSERDIRCFLGGLAMSRLHLLQGDSGTGKTSLPVAFARAIGAGLTLVEVQAGWRDRQDLIGHFNAFERRFYESEFLQALYRAQCPKYAEVPYVIVLDEMNLSHPEQYFADLLSALEQDRHLQKLDLMTAPVEPAPRLLSEGRKLKIPANVWFIGTANHDETTKDFANKTYDRAHVMELPRHREEFPPSRLQSRQPVAFEALTAAFSRAKERHADAAQKAYSFLDREFSDILNKRFRIGWGNRLQRQIEDFLPVVVAAGGSVGEATDHLLATKLLRRVRDRHDTRPDDVLALQKRVEEAWKNFDKSAPPARSLSLVQSELMRLGVDDNG